MNFQATIVFEKIYNAIYAKNTDGSRKYRYIVNIGSSRSSKTISIIDIYDTYARKHENKRLTVWRDTKTDCKKTVLNDALKRLKLTNRYKVNQDFNKTESIFTYSTGSTFEVHGTDDEETVHGLTQDVAWFNEPYKISRDTFDQIDQRTSDFVILDLNPKKDHWSDDIIKDPRTIVIHSTFKDNPFCPIEQREKILSYQSPKLSKVVIENKIKEHELANYDILENKYNFSEKEIKEIKRCLGNVERNTANDFNWQVYGLGNKSEKPHRVFKWEEIPYSQYLNLNARKIYGVDWGGSDPFGILEAKYYDGALYLNELNYNSEEKIKDKLSETEKTQITKRDEGFIIWYFNKLGIEKDKYIICDTNRPLKILALREAGYDLACEAIKGAGSIVDGVEGLNNIRVYFTNTSLNIKYEQENYSRKVDNYGKIIDDKFDDVNNHLIDPARYVYQFLRYEGVIKSF